jgi:hypothetical protein
VSVHQVANISEAKRWVAPPSVLAAGFRVRPHQVGEESWLAEHKSGQLEIHFRRYLLVGVVKGRDLGLMDYFVRRIISYFDAI